MLLSEELKSEILRDIQIGKNNNNFVHLLKTEYGFQISDCLENLDTIYSEGINDLKNKENEIIKNELWSFLNQNDEHLEINLPIEHWDYKKILFSTKSSIKGKIEFKMESIKFKLKHRFFGYSQESDKSYYSPHWSNLPLEKIIFGEFSFPVDLNGEIVYNRLPTLCKNLLKSSDEIKNQIEKIKIQKRNLDNDISLRSEEERRLLESERKRQEEIQRIEIERVRKDKLETSKSLYISSLDQDNNGEIDLIDCDSFTKLLNTKQKNIIEIDKSYIQKFVKISIYIKTKKSNIQKLFQTIKSVKYENELEELVGLLQNQVHTYNLLVFHSINMITSLTESELITFYEIYECFDKLGVFNSNWENEVSTNLLNINSSIDEVNQSIINLDDNISRGLQNLMYSINDMENNIINSINELTYTTDYSFGKLNNVIEGQLSDINSSLNFNNLLTGIQTYQMYKINQNTKRIG